MDNFLRKREIKEMSSSNSALFEKIFFMSKTDIERQFEYLGQGAGRAVYGINNRYVIKLSKSDGGDKQCETEEYIYKNAPPYLKKYLCPVIWYKDDMVIMKRATSLVKNNEDRHKNIFRLLGIRIDDPFYKKVNKLVDLFDLLYGDVKSLSSWGLLDGRLVLIDYGCTYKIYKEYFS